MKIDLDLNSVEVDKFLDIINFLDQNKETILNDIKPTLQNFLNREDMFQGGFKIKFNQEFENLVLKELKYVVLNHFELDSETLAIIMDKDILNLVGILEYFLNKENYK